MDPKEQNQDAVADENTGAAQPVADTKAAEETTASSDEDLAENTDDVEGA